MPRAQKIHIHMRTLHGRSTFACGYSVHKEVQLDGVEAATWRDLSKATCRACLGRVHVAVASAFRDGGEAVKKAAQARLEEMR